MKYLFLGFIFFISFLGFSQQSGIADGSWYLYNMVINDENNLSHFNDSGNPVATIFYSNGEERYFTTEFCDSHGGEIHYNSEASTFTVNSFYQTLEGCDTIGSIGNIDTDSVLESARKFDLFFYSSAIFNYEIIEKNLDQPKELIITATNGDLLIYRLETLSTINDDLNISFSLYPNPVKEELFISNTHSYKAFNIEVYDILGKLKISEKRTESINVENLSRGVYFLLIKDHFGNSTQKKFIKQ